MTYLDRNPDYGVVGSVELTPTILCCGTCDRNLALCRCEHLPETTHERTVIKMLHRRRHDLPENLCDLYREPVWADA